MKKYIVERTNKAELRPKKTEWERGEFSGEFMEWHRLYVSIPPRIHTCFRISKGHLYPFPGLSSTGLFPAKVAGFVADPGGFMILFSLAQTLSTSIFPVGGGEFWLAPSRRSWFGAGSRGGGFELPSAPVPKRDHWVKRQGTWVSFPFVLLRLVQASDEKPGCKPMSVLLWQKLTSQGCQRKPWSHPFSINCFWFLSKVSTLAARQKLTYTTRDFIGPFHWVPVLKDRIGQLSLMVNQGP